MVYTTHVDTPIGVALLTSDGEALTGLRFDTLVIGRRDDGLPVFSETKQWLDRYFSGQIPDFTPKLAFCTTPFRTAVYEQLLNIPYGQTVSYGTLAKALHSSARAVGGAVGHNPILLIVPCHRVIGARGTLVGFHAGLDRKRFLLALEHDSTIRG